MAKNRLRAGLIFVLLLCSLTFVIVQAGQQHRTLIVTGHTGELAVVEMGGRFYVEIQALAQIANASINFNGNQMALTLPGSSAHADLSSSSGSQPATVGLSKEFIRAAIEEMSIVREWRSTLTNAVQRGYPVTDDWMANFRDEARKSLRLVQVAGSTESDRNAFVLLTNVFNHMNELSDRFLEANRTRTYISPDALNNDPLDQSILNCAHALAAMAANGQFVDEASCH
ncbi:MAG TPA: hypothetical protein VNH19_21560 [Candidatus Limnocylindrales bacterium]|jgi:hypothetical protein|nr:hypothetical protein [Candidatus Limnocylindrales bacterium]